MQLLEVLFHSKPFAANFCSAMMYNFLKWYAALEITSVTKNAVEAFEVSQVHQKNMTSLVIRYQLFHHRLVKYHWGSLVG